ncbi:MAG: Hsp33 family molecular chaperone HslO, partial [Alcanivoracaceae bacterium]
MSNADIKQRFLFPDSDIRGEIVRLENTLAPALQQRGYPMAMEGLLSEAMAAVVLMAGTLKFRGRLSLQARGEGPVSLLLAESTHDNGVRGLVQHRKDDGQYHSLADMLGSNAIMALTIRPDEGRQYQGVVPLEGENLAACLAGYFNQSEQLPTRLWLAAGNGRAAGLLIQRLPEKVASAEDNALTWEHV